MVGEHTVNTKIKSLGQKAVLEEMNISRARMGFLGEKRHYCECIMGEESELNTEKSKERKEAQRLLSELIIMGSQSLFSFYAVSLVIHKIKLFCYLTS